MGIGPLLLSKPLAEHSDPIVRGPWLERRSSRNLELWKVAPALLVAHQPAAEVGVNRVDRKEQVERRKTFLSVLDLPVPQRERAP